MLLTAPILAQVIRITPLAREDRLLVSFDVSETFTSYVEELAGAQADAISDYANLYLELGATVV